MVANFIPSRINDVVKGTWFLNVKDYGAKGNGQFVTDAAITNGHPTLTSASNPWTAADVGKSIGVYAAGNSSAILLTTILSFQSAGQVTLAASASTTQTATMAVWGTDDTAAINTAIAAATPGQSVFFPPGAYILAGAANVGTGSQIVLPTINFQTQQGCGVRLFGAVPPCAIGYGQPLTYLLAPSSDSVLWSLLWPGSGVKSVISATYAGGVLPQFSNITLELKDLCIRMPTNAPMTGLDATSIAGVRLTNIVVDYSTRYGNNAPQPTQTGSYGIKLPGNSNAAYNVIDSLCVFGAYTALYMVEHVEANWIAVSMCYIAIEVSIGNHVGNIHHLLVQATHKGIVATPGSPGQHCGIFVDLYDTERDNFGWTGSAYEVDDASNVLYGNMLYWEPGGNAARVNGGANFNVTNFAH